MKYIRFWVKTPPTPVRKGLEWKKFAPPIPALVPSLTIIARPFSYQHDARRNKIPKVKLGVHLDLRFLFSSGSLGGGQGATRAARIQVFGSGHGRPRFVSSRTGKRYFFFAQGLESDSAGTVVPDCPRGRCTKSVGYFKLFTGSLHVLKILCWFRFHRFHLRLRRTSSCNVSAGCPRVQRAREARIPCLVLRPPSLPSRRASSCPSLATTSSSMSTEPNSLSGPRPARHRAYPPFCPCSAVPSYNASTTFYSCDVISSPPPLHSKAVVYGRAM